MYKFSTEKDEQAYAQLMGQVSKLAPSPVAEFGFVSVEAMENNTVSSTPGTFPSPLTGTNLTSDPDRQKPYSAAFATFEEDFWLLDGHSRKIAPNSYSKPPEGQDNAFGFVSSVANENQLSGSDGAFSTPVSVNITLNRVGAWLGMSLQWWKGTAAGLLADEYAIDFDIVTYDNKGREILRVPVRDNASTDWNNEEQYGAVKTVEIVVYKWSRSNRRVRLTSIELGQTFRYEGEQIRSMEHSAEVNPLSLTMPSSQFRLTIIDRNNDFDADNPEGKFRYLVQNLPLRVSVEQPYFDGTSLQTLPIPIGTFFLDDWYDGDNESEYTFVAKDLIGLMAKASYYKGRRYDAQKMDLEDFLEEILDDARLTLYAQGMWEYIGISNYKVYPVMPVVTHREAVQFLANANACTAYPDRAGKLSIRPRDDTRHDYTITGAMQEERYPKPSRLPPLSRTLYRYHKYSKSTELKTQEIQFIVPPAGRTDTLFLSLNRFADIQSITFSNSSGISYVIYGSGVELTVTGSGNGTEVRTATITLYPIDDIAADAIVQNLDEFEQEVIGEDLEVNNEIVVSAPEGETGVKGALELAQWVNEEAISRRTYQLNVQPDLRLDVGDIVKLYRPNLSTAVSPDQTVWVRILSKTYGLSDSQEYMTITVRGGGYEDV